MSHHHNTNIPKKRLHQDWRFFVAVALMLIAMVAYVMTLDLGTEPMPACVRAAPAVDA